MIYSLFVHVCMYGLNKLISYLVVFVILFFVLFLGGLRYSFINPIILGMITRGIFFVFWNITQLMLKPYIFT